MTMNQMMMRRRKSDAIEQMGLSAIYGRSLQRFILLKSILYTSH